MKIQTVLAVLSIVLLTASCDDSSGIDPVYRGRSPEKKLSIAISRNDIEMVEKIINRDGFNVNSVIGTTYGEQPLHVAAYYGRYDIAKLLLKKGADVNGVKQTRARTPLLTAIWKNQFDFAILLLENGADPTIPTSEGESPCEYAKRTGRVQILPHLPSCA